MTTPSCNSRVFSCSPTLDSKTSWLRLCRSNCSRKTEFWPCYESHFSCYFLFYFSSFLSFSSILVHNSSNLSSVLFSISIFHSCNFLSYKIRSIINYNLSVIPTYLIIKACVVINSIINFTSKYTTIWV